MKGKKSNASLREVEKQNIELKAKLEARESMHKEYMLLLQNKFELRIPAKVQIGQSIFNVVLVDKDGNAIKEDIKPQIKLEQKKEDLQRSYII